MWKKTFALVGNSHYYLSPETGKGGGGDLMVSSGNGGGIGVHQQSMKREYKNWLPIPALELLLASKSSEAEFFWKTNICNDEN